MSQKSKKKKKDEKRNPLEDVPPYLRYLQRAWIHDLSWLFFRDFISSIALKEEPESPGTLRKRAQEKRKQAQEGKDDSAQIKKMMSGVDL